MRADVEQLFHEVADLSAETRGRYLDQRRVGSTMRCELEQLLAFDASTIPSLERNIGDVAARALSRVEPQGTLCGPYRLGKVIGRGGMGTVYLAERVDGEVAQRVAVKLLRAGTDDFQLRLRFLAERQILATLSHPNVARLFDAGHREDGQPYLVMEFVDGKAIDAFADGLALRQKIALFLRVCAAVGYLHRNLVVHRDLKPANILVTPDGEPKLLDFGIARILDLTTDRTVTGQRMLTPDYASPEQMAGRQVSTASDVYSLGAVLYRLLTGESPHQFDCDSAKETSPTVSTRIKPPSEFSADVKGDLEFVLMKALRQDPQERYATVEQFAEDLENFLDLRPIRARRGDVWYRTRKFLRRYWVLATAAGLVTASLATGLYVANRERAIAERRFGQLRQLSKKVIDLDAAIRTLPGSIDARHKLVAATLAYLEGLRHEASNNPELALEVADGYWRMGRIQGVNAESNLGDSAKAEQSLKRADELVDGVLGVAPEHRNALLRSAVIEHDRMILADTEQRREDALTHARAAAAQIEKLLSRDDARNPLQLDGFFKTGDSPDQARSRVASLYGNIALTHVNLHLYADGARFARKAAELAGTMPPAAALQPQAQALSVLANALRYQGDLDAALAAIRQAKQLLDKSPEPAGTSRFFARYGVLLREGMILGEANAVSLNRTDEAVAVFEQTLAMTDEAARRDPRDSASRSRVGTTARELGSILSERNPRRALAVFDLGIQRLSEAGKGVVYRRERAVLLARSSAPLRHLGRMAEAKSRIDGAFAILKDTGDYPSERIRLASEDWTALSALADYQADTGDARRALETYEQLLHAVMATKPEPLSDLRDAPKLSLMYETLTGLYSRTGDRAKAAQMLARRLDLWSQWQYRLPQNAFIRRQFEAAAR